MFGLKRIAKDRDPGRRSHYMRRLVEVLSDDDGAGEAEDGTNGQEVIEPEPNPESGAGLAAAPAGPAGSTEDRDSATDTGDVDHQEAAGPSRPLVVLSAAKPAPIATGTPPGHTRQRRTRLAVVTDAPDVPDEMRVVHGRIAQWRKSHTGRTPMPEELWASAAELAAVHGVFRTAKVLRLDYRKLKRLTSAPSPALPSAASPFVQASACARLSALAPAPVSECIIELEGPRGKMRIQWRGSTAPDLAGLSRALLDSD